MKYNDLLKKMIQNLNTSTVDIQNNVISCVRAQDALSFAQKINCHNLFIIIYGNRRTINRTKVAINNLNKSINIITIDEFLKGELDYMRKQIDNILSNPPYQGTNSSEPLWQKITLKLKDMLKPGQKMSIVHPGIWKQATNYLVSNPKETLAIRNMMLNNTVTDLHTASTKEGFETFGAHTTYDYYVIINDNKFSSIITINTKSDGKITIDTNKIKSIPVDKVKEYSLLLPDNESDRINIGIKKANTNDYKLTKDEKYNIPTILKLNKNTFEEDIVYIKTLLPEQAVPKLIISRGGTYSFLDTNGTYACKVDGFYILDDVKTLYKIQKVLDTSDEFRTLLSKISGSDDKRTLDPKRLSRQYLFELKKDFWKDFYTDDMDEDLKNKGFI